jgi:hypothetical protein
MMELSPDLRLAMTLRAQPGSYALLLGSGVSRSAGVPTGYDVLLDLINRIAAVEGADMNGAPEDWYRGRFGVNPTYDGVLDQLTLSPLERRSLLRRFFEPTPDEAEQGLKGPTPAHHAVARLVAAGLVSMVLETNFDRLTEQALDAAGVPYVVASTPDGIDALKPLHLQRCIVVKLHGDYLDPTMLNTAVELAHYEPAVDELLRRVFDEHGLVIAGWSARWDPALRHALQRVVTHRFGTYWVEPGELQSEANELAHRRRAVIVSSTADAFLTRVAETADALAECERPDPRSVDATVAIAKHALAGRGSRIILHDCLKEALAKAQASPIVTRTTFSGANAATFQRDVERLEADVEPAAALVAVCAYWGDDGTDSWWLPALSQLGEPRSATGSTALIQLTRYPATVLANAGGTAAVAAGRWQLVAAIHAVFVRDTHGRATPLVGELAPERVLAGIPPATGSDALLRPSSHLRERLWPIVSKYLLLTSSEYEQAADMFEYITAASLIDLDAEAAVADDQTRAFPQRYLIHLKAEGTWQNYRARVSRLVSEAIASQGERFGPLTAGLFGGEIERLVAAQRALDERFSAAYSNRPLGG